MKTLFRIVVGAMLISLSGLASAGAVNCDTDTSVNYMTIDSTIVDSCADAGEGNLTGNPLNDLFINGAGAADGYENAGKHNDGDSPNIGNPYNIGFSFTNNCQGGDTSCTTTGYFWFDQTFWDDYDDGAIGFKFGTGNQPDEWFVYILNQDQKCNQPNGGQNTHVCAFTFNNVDPVRGGGLSHVTLYGTCSDGECPDVPVPTPGTLALLGVGLLGLGIRRKRKLIH